MASPVLPQRDLTGQRFGHLTVIGRALVPLKPCEVGKRPPRSGWLCRCDCGVEKPLTASPLVHGRQQSCGCSRTEKYTKHGQSKKSPEYFVWVTMRQRCFNPRERHYENYGGRGITVCPEWSDYAVFLRDMGLRPSSKHSIERKDNDGPYAPWNCRWATRAEQNNNKRTSRRVMFRGREQTITEWSIELGWNESVLRGRLNSGWTLEEAFLTPKGGSRRAVGEASL